MTSNGATAQDHAPPEEPVDEPDIDDRDPMDYWREMTQRQVQRLTARIADLEAEAKPLREQVKALDAALSAIAVAGGARAGGLNLQITEDERVLVARLVEQGMDTSAIAKRLPHVKKSQLYSAVYAARDKLAKQ